jgi:hypothetical protein
MPGPCPFTLKSILMQKKNDGNSKISPPCKKYNLQKNPPKRNQNPSSHYNIITNLKFQHNPKYHLSKNTHIKIDLLLLLLPRGPKSLELATILYNEAKHKYPCLLGRQGQ